MQKTILVVDDESLLVEMISRYLRAHGYAVTMANSGIEAFSFLKQIRFDLALCDIHMDGMDGFAVLAACKAVNPRTKVILCSGDIVYKTVSRVFSNGADGFLAKPFLLGELLHQVNKCFAWEQPDSLGILAVPDQHGTPRRPEKIFCACP